ncbi:MAG TPA: hypothetical protein DEQ60_04780, partial [Methylophaga sp.]|nr:hypothetical protein [Methylophaga sp.]
FGLNTKQLGLVNKHLFLTRKYGHRWCLRIIIGIRMLVYKRGQNIINVRERLARIHRHALVEQPQRLMFLPLSQQVTRR